MGTVGVAHLPWCLSPECGLEVYQCDDVSKPYPAPLYFRPFSE